MRVLIVDDEPLARGVIAQLLNKRGGMEVVGQARNGDEAVKLIGELQPDLVFLDVQMPGLDGFGVVRAFPADEFPWVIFATAFDEHALQAFEVSAVDYLLKPFTDERFDRALDRVIRLQAAAKQADLAARLETLVQQADTAPSDQTRFAIKSGGSVYFLDFAEIDWIEAANNFVRFHASGKRHLLRATMASVERRLDPAAFARIHRSTIVRLDRVRQLKPQEHGDYLVVLRDGTELRMSRRRREELRARLPL